MDQYAHKEERNLSWLKSRMKETFAERERTRIVSFDNSKNAVANDYAGLSIYVMALLR